jgi:hypothetical protein
MTNAVRRLAAPVFLALTLVASLDAQESQEAPSPEEFFGFPMGAERQLAGWDRIVRYFHEVDRRSERVLVQTLGKTSMGNPYIMAVVSTPETLANLSKYQGMQKQLADPRRTSDEEAARIAREGKAVLLIGMNVHATEIGNSQMANALLYKLATENSPWVNHVLNNVILLLIPSQNPDGQQMVVDWYKKNLNTPYEDSPTPDLYHKYAGHDNNRDHYMLTQVETQHLARVLYKDWFPEVYLDKHQMGSARARIFVPPFKNPANPNIDPLVWSQVNLLGQTMAAKLHEAGKLGVLWGELYTGFWQGANSTNPWWHNMVALLTETASARMATTIVQETADPDRPRHDSGRRSFGFGERDPSAPLPAPDDVQTRMNYARPWLGGTWSFADVVDYELTAALGALEGVANNREMLKRNFHLMNKRTIELYKTGSPYAYLVPPQRDPVAVAKLVQLIQAEAGEVHLAQEPFIADGKEYPAGTYVMLLAQPFGRWIKDILEPQRYPDIRWPFPNAPIDRPYDVTAWTLGMLMGVDTPVVNAPFEAKLALLTKDAEAPPGKLTGHGPVYLVGHELSNLDIATNRLLKSGADVRWATDRFGAEGKEYVPGALVVSRTEPGFMAKIARDLKLDVVSVDDAPLSPSIRLRAPRVALYEPWGGNMDAGWTRWLLEEHEFAYTHARNADIGRGDLNARFDVIILPEMSSAQIVGGLQGQNIRPEYKGGIGTDGVQNLKRFIQNGGTVITLGNAAQFAIDYLGAPFQNVLQSVDQDSFFCPGSLLRISVDTRHPIGYGMRGEADGMFIGNGAYQPSGPLSSVSTSIIASYPTSGRILRSGWIIGESMLRGNGAVLEATHGRGRIIMHTFRVQSRAQSWGTFKLLFNSIFYGAARAPDPETETFDDVARR